MTNKEFIKRLQDNKYFEDTKKLEDYRFPVINFYIIRLAPPLNINGQIAFIPQALPIKTKEDWICMNILFDMLRYRVNEFKTTLKDE